MIPRAAFGKTGHDSRRTIFGAAALSRASEADADRALELVTRYGLDHLDTASAERGRRGPDDQRRGMTPLFV